MAKEIVKTSKAPPPIGAYNQAVWAHDTLYLSGQIAIDPATGELQTDNIQQQTRQVMENLGAILQAAGSGFDKVVKCSIFLDDIDNFQPVNEVYASYFEAESAPAREAIEAAHLPKGVQVEISAIAVK
jgi:2-iminobutanoate/2-iminopropanoate deaminase